MRYALMSEPQQGLAYAEILALARAAEAAPALGAYFRSDHYGSFPGPGGQPTTDAWATLAGLARETSRIGLGTLGLPVTFRLPGNLAKVVATVDEMSGGRVELGLGAGWNEREHARSSASRSRRSPSATTCSRRRSPSSTGCGASRMAGPLTAPTGRSADAAFRARPEGGPGARHPQLILGGEGGPRLAAWSPPTRTR